MIKKTVNENHSNPRSNNESFDKKISHKVESEEQFKNPYSQYSMDQKNLRGQSNFQRELSFGNEETLQVNSNP